MNFKAFYETSSLQLSLRGLYILLIIAPMAAFAFNGVVWRTSHCYPRGDVSECRNIFFVLLATESVALADCILMVVQMLVIVEIAKPGFESSTYRLITTVYNLADPVATALSNVIGTYFQTFDTDALPLLPRQRPQAGELKARGESSKSMVLIVFVTIAVVLSAAIKANILYP
ncbi:hypothetical protein CCR75_001571 [Bremia lactucae]|uniref:Uncharacterized protein n=1 Tax=Bremia lactucae TaxID=4779 RepID=A0A976IHY8_BRELC|nr:hypothetical protein CCR75_001571 [Bremia lactucae]